jgi:type VI protein secretion system component Hcp
MPHAAVTRALARSLILAAGLLLIAGSPARAEGEGHHEDGDGPNAPAVAPPLPANGIVICFGAITTDPMVNCPGGITSVLQAVSFGVTVPVSTGTGTGGAGAGKPLYSAVSLSKRIDSSSQTLFKNALSGVRFPYVTIGFYDTAGKLSHAFLMRSASVESVNFADAVAPGGEAVEQVSLVYLAMSANF